MLEKRTLEGKVAVVTGGGGGLGAAISLTFAEAGADIIITDLRPEAGESTAQKVVDLGQRAIFIPANVTKSEEVDSMMAKAISQWGKVDILVNCVGSGVVRPGPRRSFIWEITDSEWHLGIDMNLTSAFFCSRAVAKHMMERKSGRIISFASGYGQRGMRNNFMYCAAKAGVILLTMSLALTLAQYGITANAVSPGFIGIEEPWEKYADRGGRIPMGRVGKPREVGALLLFLASDASDYITGEIFAIDGGTLAGGYAPTGYAPVSPIQI